MTQTETRAPYLQAILDRGPNGRPQGVVDTAQGFYSIGFDGNDADIVSYYDIRMKALEEFKEQAEHQDPRILPDGTLVDEYSDGKTTLLAVQLANGYSYNATFPKNKFFGHAIGQNGEFITTDKNNGSFMTTTKVEGNRQYKDISNFRPSVTHVWSTVLENGRIGLQVQKDGRVAVAYTEGKVPSHSFFFKTQQGAILTCDDSGALILADSIRLPKEISPQDRATHQQFAASTASLDSLVAPHIPLEQVRQERNHDVLSAIGNNLKKHLSADTPAADKSSSHTTRVSNQTKSANMLG